MEIKKLILRNVGRFDELEVHLAPFSEHKGNVTILIGNNGSGKTSILKSLGTSLSWLSARIQSESGKGSPIPELVVKNGNSTAAIDIEVSNDCESISKEVKEYCNYTWRIAKTKKGRKASFKSDFGGVSELSNIYRQKITNNEHASLPLVAFYSVERVVVDIPLKIRGRHSFKQLDGYDKSLTQGVDFRRFFEWFRDREDSENESGLSDEILDKLKDVLNDDQVTLTKLNELKASSKDRQLTAVRSAIYKFMPEFENLKIKRKPRLHMSIDKRRDSFDVAQLSQGEKSLMALIGDIARRLAVMNPGLENPLTGDGIVLIDEVDLHLHPKLQRTLVNQFTQTFPNCQFVLTTHSPLVISDSKNVLTYILSEDELAPVQPLYGMDVNSVLLEVMDTDIRNIEVQTKIEQFLDFIQDSAIDEAKKQLKELEVILPSDNIELVKARLLLRKKEFKNAKNN